MHDTLMDYALVMGLVCLSTAVSVLAFANYVNNYRNRPMERRNGINYYRKVVRK